MITTKVDAVARRIDILCESEEELTAIMNRLSRNRRIVTETLFPNEEDSDITPVITILEENNRYYDFSLLIPIIEKHVARVNAEREDTADLPAEPSRPAREVKIVRKTGKSHLK